CRRGAVSLGKLAAGRGAAGFPPAWAPGLSNSWAAQALYTSGERPTMTVDSATGGWRMLGRCAARTRHWAWWHGGSRNRGALSQDRRWTNKLPKNLPPNPTT